MKQRQRPKRKNSAAVATVLCFVAAIAIVGTYTLRDYKKTQQKERMAAMEEAKNMTKDKEKEETEEASGEAEKLVINTKPEADSSNTENDDTEKKEESTNASIDAQAASAGNSAVYFDDSSKLLWPVDGTILLNFSMDKTVYFSTLDQYKYNPALIISGAEGDQVISGAPGIIKSIDVTAETGTTVNVDIGNGYELFYGQLKEVPVKVGDQVEAKSVLGYVSQPTKYYSVEGCNVYFEMRKDGQPVNPVDYLSE